MNTKPRTQADRKPWKQPKGLYAGRLANNPREKAFFKQWAYENQPRVRSMSDHGTTLQVLLGKDYRTSAEISVATVIQWLGSNVGFSFLGEALDKAGYKIVSKGYTND